MTKIKICGIKTLDEVKLMNEYLPDYIGFILCPSIRQINYDQAQLLSDNLNTKIYKVGVFVQEDIKVIKKYCDNKIIDFVQLHGDENDEYYDQLFGIINCPIIRVQRVKQKEDLLHNKKGLILYDTFSQKVYGGTNQSFNHHFLKELIHPYIVAGGLNIKNIDYLINDLNVAVIDVSSGVEVDGIKNELLVKELIKKVRNKNE